MFKRDCNMTTSTGSCLCGAIAFTASDLTPVEACHCATCKQWCGGPFVYVPAREVEFTEGEPATFVTSDWGERGFCAACGSNLYWKLTADIPMERAWDICFGTLHTPPDAPMAREIFTDSAPALPAFIGDHTRMTGAQFRASKGL